MKCPSCSGLLREVEQHGVRVDTCTCGGIWFDAGELESWFDRLRPDAKRPQLADRLRVRDDEARACPHCAAAALRRFAVDDVRGSVCSQCRGVWLTAADVQRLRRLPAVASPEPDDGIFGFALCEGLAELLFGVIDGI